MEVSERPLADNECSECSRVMDVAKRVEAGFKYCSTCYARVFKSAPCQQCAKPGRFHKYASERICRTCQRESRKCSRCENPLPQASLIVGTQAYCGPCSEYIKPAKLCEGCGQYKRLISSAPGRGVFNQLCMPCLSRAAGDSATCARCHRHRKMAVKVDDKPFCVACQPENPLSYPCPTCSESVPGVGHANCSTCSAKARLKKRVLTISSTFDPAYASLLTEYGQWLGRRVTPDIAARKFVAAVPFFSKLDSSYPDLTAITLNGVVQALGVATLRRHLLCHEFLLEHFHWIDDPEFRENLAEDARVDAKLDAQSGLWWDGLVREYVQSLRSGNDIKPLTVRLYTNAAVVFVRGTKVESLMALDQKACDRGLYNRPGLRASITRFATWLQETQGIALKVAPKKKDPKIYLRRMTKEIRTVLNRLSVSQNEDERRGLLGIALSQLYAVPLKDVLRSKKSDFEMDGIEMTWRVKGESLMLTPFISSWVMRLLASRVGFEFAFGQEGSARPLSVGAAEYWVQK